MPEQKLQDLCLLLPDSQIAVYLAHLLLLCQMLQEQGFEDLGPQRTGSEIVECLGPSQGFVPYLWPVLGPVEVPLEWYYCY